MTGSFTCQSPQYSVSKNKIRGMDFIEMKPISLNHAYRGRRFATKELKWFKSEVDRMLPDVILPSGKLSVKYEFGVSSKNSDGDNLIKCFQDCLAIKYKFNDNRIYEWYIKKVDVEKGFEYIAFRIGKST